VRSDTDEQRQWTSRSTPKSLGVCNQCAAAHLLACALLRVRRPRTPTDDHPVAALWWRILDQLPAKCRNMGLIIPDAVPASMKTRTRSLDQEPPRPRSAAPSRVRRKLLKPHSGANRPTHR
jgi:hypothetical protein